jgi:hypothetical protein
VVADFYLIGWNIRVPAVLLLSVMILWSLFRQDWRLVGVWLSLGAWWIAARWAARRLREARSVGGACVLVALDYPWVWYAARTVASEPTRWHVFGEVLAVALFLGTALALPAAIEYRRLTGQLKRVEDSS